jgi:pimeloyl-ACP methyl ester carboxylesterase
MKITCYLIYASYNEAFLFWTITFVIQKEVEDLDAILCKTRAHYVFGLSSGAIISLQAALNLPAIHKLVIFEPPLFINGTVPTALIARY